MSGCARQTDYTTSGSGNFERVGTSSSGSQPCLNWGTSRPVLYSGQQRIQLNTQDQIRYAGSKFINDGIGSHQLNTEIGADQFVYQPQDLSNGLSTEVPVQAYHASPWTPETSRLGTTAAAQATPINAEGSWLRVVEPGPSFGETRFTPDGTILTYENPVTSKEEPYGYVNEIGQSSQLPFGFHSDGIPPSDTSFPYLSASGTTESDFSDHFRQQWCNGQEWNNNEPMPLLDAQAFNQYNPIVVQHDILLDDAELMNQHGFDSNPQATSAQVVSFQFIASTPQHYLGLDIEDLEKQESQSHSQPSEASSRGERLAAASGKREIARVTPLSSHSSSRTSKHTCCCKLCHTGFGRTSDLNRHYGTVHGDIRWECQVCDYANIREDKLKQHGREVPAHNGQYLPVKQVVKNNSSKSTRR